jgi:predicted RNA-binding Zn-ribbon protein involved in translation (DUF1610 family)
MTDDQHCPDCGNALIERDDGTRECYSIWAGGIELSCGWTGPPLFELADPAP